MSMARYCALMGWVLIGNAYVMPSPEKYIAAGLALWMFVYGLLFAKGQA